MAKWIDLIDPSPDELRAKLPADVQESALRVILAPVDPDHPHRPTLRSEDNYIFGILLVAVAVREEDRVYYQEIDAIVTDDTLITVSKTPPGAPPYDPRPAQEKCKPDDSGGMMLYRLIDDIADRYLDLVDALDEEIDELEDAVETNPPALTRNRLSDLRHDLVHLRHTLSPTRDAVRRVVDNVIEVEGGPDVFPRNVEIAFNSTYDKLQRSFESLELSRDLIASVRDYLQARVANDQNEVMKKLTAIASLLLLPTFIVGLYGQNFRHHFPELGWQWGYLWSWGLILVTTIVQLIYFRRNRWI